MTPPAASAANPLHGLDFRPSMLVRRTYGEPRFHTDGDVAAVAFAPDGTLWTVDEAGHLRHWGPDGQLLRQVYLSDLETLWCFGPGAKRIASGNDDLLIWDAAEGTLVRRIEQDSWVTALGFSGTGTIVASGHDDGSVRLWDATTQKPAGKFAAHKVAVSAVAFDPHGKFLATAGEDRVIRIWDARTFQIVADLVSHTDRIPAFAWAADGGLLASAGWDRSARVWRPPQPSPVMLLNSHADQVMTLAFAPRGSLLATADSDHDIHLWPDPLDGTPGAVLHGHADEIRCLAFSPDGARLASAGADRVVRVWDAKTGALVAGPSPTGNHAIAVTHVGGKTVVASAGGPKFRMYDANTGADVPPSGDGPAHSVAADPAGRWLAVGGTDHVIRLYDLNSPNSRPRRLEATRPPIGAMAFAADGSVLAHTSPADGLVWLWTPDAAGDATLILIEAADGCTLEGVAVSPDGSRVAVGGVDYLSTGERDGAVCVWDVDTKLKAFTFDLGVTAVAFDPSGRFLAGAGLTNRVYVWDLAGDSLDPVLDLDGHTDRVNAVAFSPDGNYLLSGSDDLTLRVWDVLSGRLVIARELDSAVRSVAFSPDGNSVFTGNGNTTVSQVPFENLIEE
ncbi:MAG: hypothetical protein ACRC7O_12835 [Fimbriiglobus sp.]